VLFTLRLSDVLCLVFMYFTSSYATLFVCDKVCLEAGKHIAEEGVEMIEKETLRIHLYIWHCNQHGYLFEVNKDSVLETLQSTKSFWVSRGNSCISPQRHEHRLITTLFCTRQFYATPCVEIVWSKLLKLRQHVGFPLKFPRARGRGCVVITIAAIFISNETLIIELGRAYEKR
jgi:hypothetical protein